MLFNRPKLMDYLVGGIIGNILLIFAVLSLTFVEPSYLLENRGLIKAIALASMFGGASLAGLSVLTRTQSRDMRRIIAIGIITGLFCYLVNFLLSLILLPRVFPEYEGLAAFSTGSVFGALLKSLKRRQSFESMQ